MKTNALLFAASLATAVFSASAGSAQMREARPSAIEFNVAGDDFELPIPEGYCFPTGEAAVVSKRFADGDSQNVTPVDLQRCGTFGADYFLIKSPRNMPAIPVPKAMFIELIAKELATSDSAQLGFEKGQEDVTAMTDGAIDVAPTSYGFAGTDEDCAYLAGVLQVSSKGVSTEVRAASCMTLVGTRNLVIHSYDATSGGASIETLKTRSRAIANSIIAK